MQHLAHVTTRCYGLATRSTPPRLTQRTVKTGISIYRPRRSYNAAFSPRNDSLLRTALTLQQLAHVMTRCYGLATTTRPYQRNVKTGTSIYQRPTDCPQRPSSCIQRPTDLSCPQRPSSCIQRPDQSQLPATTIQLHSTTRPTSAARNDHPVAFNDSTDLSCPQRPYSRIQRPDRSQLTCIKHLLWGCPRGVMVKAMNCGIVVREFVLQSRYYVHFRANTLGKGMNPLILPPAMGK